MCHGSLIRKLPWSFKHLNGRVCGEYEQRAPRLDDTNIEFLTSIRIRIHRFDRVVLYTIAFGAHHALRGWF